MVLVGAYNAVARYVERDLGLSLASNAYVELQWYLFGAIFLLAGAYTLRRDAHVRVDVLYDRLGRLAESVEASVQVERLGVLPQRTFVSGRAVDVMKHSGWHAFLGPLSQAGDVVTSL